MGAANNLVALGAFLAVIGCGVSHGQTQDAATKKLEAEKRLAALCSEYLDARAPDTPDKKDRARIASLEKQMRRTLVELGVDPDDRAASQAATRRVLKQHRPAAFKKLVRMEKISQCFQAMLKLCRELNKHVNKMGGAFPDDLAPFEKSLKRPGLAGVNVTWLAKGLNWNQKDYGDWRTSSRTPIMVALPAETAAVMMFRDFHIDRIDIVSGKVRKRPHYGDNAEIIAALTKAGVKLKTDP